MRSSPGPPGVSIILSRFGRRRCQPFPPTLGEPLAIGEAVLIPLHSPMIPYTLWINVYDTSMHREGGEVRKPIAKELVAASSRPMVLSILAGGESYGYEILKQVKMLSGGELEWSDGMLYPVLHRLERDGLIAGRWELTREGRRRKYYRLTRGGKRQLGVDRESWLAVHGALELSWGGSDV